MQTQKTATIGDILVPGFFDISFFRQDGSFIERPETLPKNTPVIDMKQTGTESYDVILETDKN